jgi:hypothetical protein
MVRFVLLFVTVAACGGPSSPAPSKPAAKPRDAAALGPMCERYYVKQRSCASEYLSALLDVRIEYDMPSGIAARAKTDGRDAVLAEARVEWERDSAPAAVTAICQQMVDKTPPQHVERLLQQGEACEAVTECVAFAKCAVDTERVYIKSGAMH